MYAYRAAVARRKDGRTAPPPLDTRVWAVRSRSRGSAYSILYRSTGSVSCVTRVDKYKSEVALADPDAVALAHGAKV